MEKDTALLGVIAVASVATAISTGITAGKTSTGGGGTGGGPTPGGRTGNPDDNNTDEDTLNG